MRWLLVKDLQILRRSPLLVGLLVLYPIVIATLIGFALSRGPDKPRVAFVNLVPESANKIELGSEQIDVSRYAQQLFEAIDAVRIDCEGETDEECERRAVQKVKDGDVLAALVIPEDVTDNIQALQNLRATEAPRVRVYYNAEDPVKARFVRDTIQSQVADANRALTEKFTEIALSYLDLLVEGGTFELPILGGEIEILGLRRSEAILQAAEAGLDNPTARAQVEKVEQFARLARENLDLTDEVLGTVGEPLRVDQKIVEGGATPLSSFAVAIAVAVSLMFVTVLLAAGTLALEREENAFRRLVRGLVSHEALLAEKAILAAGCALVVALLMLAGLGLFVDLRWSRFPLWAAATAAGALGFAALGLAIGALTREVRAASLLAFMLSLPIAFLALVPSGSVAPALYDVIRAISAVFPFKPTLSALNAALNDSGAIEGHIAHLAVLTFLFGIAARLGLRRFA